LQRTGGSKGTGLPNKSPKLEIGEAEDHSEEELGSGNEAEEVIAISSGDDADPVAGPDAADVSGADEEDEADGDFAPGAEEEDMEVAIINI
jgi:hypothetical protein